MAGEPHSALRADWSQALWGKSLQLSPMTTTGGWLPSLPQGAPLGVALSRARPHPLEAWELTPRPARRPGPTGAWNHHHQAGLCPVPAATGTSSDPQWPQARGPTGLALCPLSPITSPRQGSRGGLQEADTDPRDTSSTCCEKNPASKKTFPPATSSLLTAF